MTRRHNGEGTVYQRKDGRWCAAGYVLHTDGTRARVSAYARNRKDAADKLAALITHDSVGMPVATHKATTVGLYLKTWLDQVARHKLRANTFVTYQGYIDRYLIPGLGKHRLATLTPKTVRDWVTRMSTVCQCCVNGWDKARDPDAVLPSQRRKCCALGRCCQHVLKTNTVHYLKGILSVAISHAVREDELPRNVCSAVVLPTVRNDSFIPYTAEEAKRLLMSAQYNRLHALFELAIRLGLRRGELVGLMWTDIDWDTAILSIRRTCQQIRGRKVICDTKSKSSSRRLPLTPECIAALKLHQERQDFEAMTAGKWEDTGFVFTNLSGGIVDPAGINRAMDVICDRAKIRRARFHDLRHTCATLLLEQGVELVAISSLLGHAQLSVTANVYTHVRLRLQHDALGSLSNALADNDNDNANTATEVQRSVGDDPPLTTCV